MDDLSPRPLGPDDPGPEPSVLFVVWPERERPLEEEIRLALLAEYPGLTQLDELESADEILWSVPFRVPGADGAGDHDYIVWAEPRGESADDAWTGDDSESSPELRAVMECRWLLGVETRLDPRRPQEAFHRQLRFASTVAVPGLTALYDDNALCLRGGRYVEDLCACPVPPRASTLYGVHIVEESGELWLRTHGLGRTGLPDLDLIGIPVAALSDAHELLDAVVDALLAGLSLDSYGRLQLGEGIMVRPLSLEDGLEQFPPEVIGGRLRRSELEGHSSRRLILVDPDRDGAPLRQMAEVRDTGTLFKSRGETERQRSLSVDRWGTFGQLFTINRRADWRFHVKMAWQRDHEPATREHLWFEVMELRPGQVRGRLLNEPLDVEQLAPGQELWQHLNRLTDWLIVTPDGTFDPETASVLLD